MNYYIHSESSYGQFELVLSYTNQIINIIDNTYIAKDTIIAVAHKYNMKVLFLPKFHIEQAGNGIHIHISIYGSNTNDNLMINKSKYSANNNVYTEDIHCVHHIGQSFIEGILYHLKSLVAFTIPTVNSYRRMGKGCWTGSSVTYGWDDKDCPIRLIRNIHSGYWDHFEYKLCDSACSLYLAISCILLAGLDGIQKQIILRQIITPSTENDDDMNNKTNMMTTTNQELPSTLFECYNHLENNTLYQNKLTKVLLKSYIALRRAEIQYSLTEMHTLDIELQNALRAA